MSSQVTQRMFGRGASAAPAAGASAPARAATSNARNVMDGMGLPRLTTLLRSAARAVCTRVQRFPVSPTRQRGEASLARRANGCYRPLPSVAKLLVHDGLGVRVGAGPGRALRPGHLRRLGGAALVVR